MKKCNLSFAIVTYNNEKIITDTINSLVANIPEEYNYKVLVFDNDSNDNTVELIRGLKGNIEVFELKQNLGFGYGHNQALNVIDSDYHFVVNPDILLEDKSQIRKMCTYLDENSEIGLLSPLIVYPDLRIQYLCKVNPTVFDMLIRRISPNFLKARQDRYVMKDTGYDKIMDLEYASGCFMAFRTSIFREIDGFDEDYFMYLEDADITRRTNEVSKCIFYPDARVVHAWERSAHKSLKFAIITMKSMITYFNKWGWKLI